MMRARIVVAVGLIVTVVAVAGSPAAADADQRHHHRARVGPHASWHAGRDIGHRGHHRHFGHHGHRQHSGHHGHHGHHRHFGHHGHQSFVTFYSPAPVVYYTPPPVYYAPPPVYYAPPVVYQAPPTSAPGPATAMPRVVEYATGRYELRGDGVSIPYEWVWMPNPPPAPPAPVEPPVTRQSTPVAAVPSAPRDAFRWTDEHGVTTWTDRLDSIPERYRAQVQRLR